jgi:hypothetical protein
MEKDKASREEMIWKQEEYCKAIDRQREADEQRLADIEENDRIAIEELTEPTRRCKNSEQLHFPLSCGMSN